jgi:hypothetical protein
MKNCVLYTLKCPGPPSEAIILFVNPSSLPESCKSFSAAYANENLPIKKAIDDPTFTYGKTCLIGFFSEL